MSTIPKDPKDIFNELTKDYQDIYGSDLVSIILYGSAASGNYIPKKSDINVLIVLTEEGINRLHQSLKIVEKWHKKKRKHTAFSHEAVHLFFSGFLSHRIS